MNYELGTVREIPQLSVVSCQLSVVRGRKEAESSVEESRVEGRMGKGNQGERQRAETPVLLDNLTSTASLSL